MSLLGNRGRFTKDEKIEKSSVDIGLTSIISSIGKNPLSLFSIKKEKPVDNDIKNNINTKNVGEYHNANESGHRRYNDIIDKKNRKKDLLYSDYKTEKRSVIGEKRKPNVILLVSMFVVEVLTIAAILTFGTVFRLTKMTQVVPFDPKVVVSPYINETTVNIMKGYKTVAVFGVDSRNGSVSQGNNADVNLIINLNVENGDIQLVSIYRDLYLSVTDNNSYDKLNAAYRRGGPEAAVKALNKNLDLGIVNFFAFNWKAVADGIELLGGIDLEITRSEYKYMNAFIHETCIATGIDAKNPAAHYIKSAGMQHLDGVQAVAYGRLRLMDSDFQRVDRQKKVISLCLQKAKTLDIPTLRLIMEAVLPQIAYEFDMNEMVSLLRIVRNVNITDSMGCPETSNVVTMDMGGSGACVVPLNLEKAVVKLHKALFNEDDYNVSTAVKRYSNRITELRHKYQEENELKASIKQSEEEELKSLNDSSDTTKKTTRRKVSTKSNADNKNLPISESYEEEPESDEISESSKVNTNAPTETSGNGSEVVVIDGPPTGNDTNETTTSSNGGNVVIGEAPGTVREETTTTTNGAPISIDETRVAPIETTINSGPISGGPIAETSPVEPIIVIP